ncbi:metallophosphoesterase [Polyangium jinanense]|uniref:metallophosphoesterase n=1 Tax=Polyangium jinanense TaxID=2829994 RepID=UPI00233FB94B|nr:metallophosphoesterase [Polyangium jinanense]MDC3952611.1 metallophosphoesterase [Polyangium jinanense]
MADSGRSLSRTWRLFASSLVVCCFVPLGIASCSSGDAVNTSTTTGGTATTGAGASGAGGAGNGGAGSGGAGATGGAGGTGGSSTSSTGHGGSGGGPAAKVVRLLAIGDTGEGNEAQHAVADRMSEKCEKVGGCDAVLVNGDNFYDNGVANVDDPQWVAKFEEPYDRPHLDGVPFYAVLGNHDHGPTSSGNKQAQIDYASLPLGSGPGMRRSEKWHMPAAWYDVKIGHVHLFALDTVDFLNGTQKDDMSARVKNAKATWKIVVGHHPRFTSGEHFWDNNLLGIAGLFTFQKAIYCGADMFMTGHDHNLEFIDRGRDDDCPGTYFVVSGAGAKTRDTFDFVPTDEKQLYFSDGFEGFAYMEFDGPKLSFEFIDRNGAVVFSKTMTK